MVNTKTGKQLIPAGVPGSPASLRRLRDFHSSNHSAFSPTKEEDKRIVLGLEYTPTFCQTVRTLAQSNHLDNPMEVAPSPASRSQLSHPASNPPPSTGGTAAAADASTIEIDSCRSAILTLNFIPDGRYLFSSDENWEGRLWCIEDGHEVGSPMALDEFGAISISPDGKWIVTGHKEGATVRDAKTCEKVVQLRGYVYEVSLVDVSPDSTRVATAWDARVHVWHIKTGERLLGSLEHEYLISAVRFSPSGDRIAVSTCQRESIRIYDSHSGQQLADIPVKVVSWSAMAATLAWCSDDQRLFVIAPNDVLCLNTSTPSVTSKWPHHTQEGDHNITLASNDRFLVCSTERSITFWDTSKHVRIGPVLEHASPVRSIALSLDNCHLASGEASGKMTVRRLTNILPRSYFAGVGAIQRLQQLLKERTAEMQEMRANFERMIEFLREDPLDKEKSLLPSKSDVERLEARLSDTECKFQGLQQELTKFFDTGRPHNSASCQSMDDSV